MTQAGHTFDIYLEIGKKRTFAGVLDWPGWCRSGRNDEASLQALLDYGPRYAPILQTAGIEFRTPSATTTFVVVERLAGTQATDFGAPHMIPASDRRPVAERELQRFHTLLRAYWQAFDATVAAATDKELRKGPRGGGRDLEEIVQHGLDADAAYLARLAWKFKRSETMPRLEALDHTRQAMLAALTASAHGETPTQGARGGAVWPPRYFVRRVAWHLLDHLWEIEDRVTSTT